MPLSGTGTGTFAGPEPERGLALAVGLGELYVAGGQLSALLPLIRAQVAHWGRVVKDAGIKLPQ